MTAGGRFTEPLLPDDPRRLGPFALVGRLGSGGMGVVYLARHDDGRTAAVKVVHPHLIGDRDFRVRFGREIAVARSVDAPWTAHVVDADPQSARPWLATEYVDGPSLEEQVTRTGPLPPPAPVFLARRLAEALAGLHAGGVVHRDLKPSNVLLAGDGPRLIDFGIARSLDATKITNTGLVIGTPAYMAPEQAEGEESGPPADVFSLASVLYFAATGAGPFGTTAHPAAMLLRILQRTPDVAALPAPLADWLAPCFARDPAARPTAAQLVDAWTPAPRPVDLTKRVPVPAPTRTLPPRAPRAPRLLVLTNVVLALLVVGALVASFTWVPTTSVSAAAAPARPPDGALPQVTKVADVRVDARVSGIGAAPDGRTVLVKVPGGVRFLDTASRSLSPLVPTPEWNAGAFSPDGARVYLGGQGIWAVDVRAATVTQLGEPGTEITDLTVDPDGRTAYVGYDRRTEIGVVDLGTGRQTDSIPVGFEPGEVVAAGSNRLFVSGMLSNGTYQGGVVDVSAHRILQSLPDVVTAAAVTADARSVYVLQGLTVRRVDVASGDVDGTGVRVFSRLLGSGLAVTPTGESMVVADYGGSTLHVADTTGLPRQDVDTGDDIRGLTMSPDGRTLYVAVGAGSSTVQVYDTSGLIR